MKGTLPCRRNETMNDCAQSTVDSHCKLLLSLASRNKCEGAANWRTNSPLEQSQHAMVLRLFMSKETASQYFCVACMPCLEILTLNYTLPIMHTIWRQLVQRLRQGICEGNILWVKKYAISSLKHNPILSKWTVSALLLFFEKVHWDFILLHLWKTFPRV